jgi:hypothetical protein
MLELCKEILQKVSFDRKLFVKELKKAVKWVSKDELATLKIWCLNTYGKMYKKEIIETFSMQNSLA